MSLTATEEALVRQLLDQQAAILSLAGNEATITSKLGATKVSLSDLVAASSLADADLLLTRQGTTDKSVRADILAAYTAAELNLSALAPLASPALTGTPTAPTATAGTNTTQLATSAFVTSATSGYAPLASPALTGSATLNGTTNNTVQLSGIVTTLGLELGDVIRIQHSGYDKLHTVEAITDDNSIVVNYEHAGNRGNGSLKLANTTATVTITRIAKWYNAPIGLGQAWVSVVSSRGANVTYTNTGSRPIEVAVTYRQTGGDNGAAHSFIVGGVTVGRSVTRYGSNEKASFTSAIVPAGASYSVAGATDGALYSWVELR